MLGAQQHLRMFLDRFHRLRRIVLAAHRQDYPATVEVEHDALEVFKRGAGIAVAELDAVDPVLADDAAPERVVQIDGQRLATPPSKRMDEALPLPREMDHLIRRERQAGGEELAIVAERSITVA